jgi:hypothetical protein
MELEVQGHKEDALTAAAAHTDEVAALNQKVADAEAKAPTPEQLDELVAKRTAVVDAATKLVPTYKVESKDCETIRREIVADKCPELDLTNLSVDYIRARFDSLASDPSTPITDASKSGVNTAIGKAFADAGDGDKDEMAEARANRTKRAAN